VPGNTTSKAHLQNIERGMPDLTRRRCRFNRPDVWHAQEVAAGVVFSCKPGSNPHLGTNLIIDGALTKAV